MSKLLINERQLQVLPTLAKRIGLNEAIAVQQLHFAVQTYDSRVVELDGAKWLRADLSFWVREFPWWSERTIKRIWATLRDGGLVHTSRGREANVYRIDYVKLDAVTGQIVPSHTSDRPVEPGQDGPSPSIGEGTAERTEENDAGATSAPTDTLPGLEPPPPSPAPANATDASTEAVWAHYVKVFGDRLRVRELTAPRIRDIKKALKATSENVELLQLAIDGLKSYRMKHPQGSQDVGLSVIFATGPHSGKNLTDQISWWAEQADHDLRDSSRKIPLDLSGIPSVTLGMIRAKRREVAEMYAGGGADAEKRGRAAADWLKEHCGHEPIIEDENLKGWRYV